MIRFVDFHQDSSAKDKWIGAYSIGPTFTGKLGYPRKKKNKEANLGNAIVIVTTIFTEKVTYDVK